MDTSFGQEGVAKDNHSYLDREQILNGGWVVANRNAPGKYYLKRLIPLITEQYSLAKPYRML